MPLWSRTPGIRFPDNQGTERAADLESVDVWSLRRTQPIFRCALPQHHRACCLISFDHLMHSLMEAGIQLPLPRTSEAALTPLPFVSLTKSKPSPAPARCERLRWVCGTPKDGKEAQSRSGVRGSALKRRRNLKSELRGIIR